MKKEFVVALAGNPNTGKSTVFNALTGMKQHTGNWSGKTVEASEGRYRYKDIDFKVVDLPGIYSFYSERGEEKAAKEYICSKQADLVVVTADATCLERGINLCFQAMDMFDDVVLCLNLMDEAQKHNIKVNKKYLEEKLKIPVIFASARQGEGIDEIRKTAYKASVGRLKIKPFKPMASELEKEERSLKYMALSAQITEKAVKKDEKSFVMQRKIDSLVLSKTFGIPIILLMLTFMFFITAKAANYPSKILALFFSAGLSKLNDFLSFLNVSPWAKSLFVDGIFNTTAFVVSVMLPPMAVFFPLFTFLEDCGFLPRIAFCLDGIFQKANASGKQAVTSIMAMGCNAAAVSNCRIIEGRREYLTAVITNSFITCNGRLPLIIVLTSIFLGKGIVSSLYVLLFMVIAVGTMLLVSFILSKTLLKGENTSFILELPPYRKPQTGKIIVRSILDRTIFVLGRAITAAMPAGAIIWLMKNINFNGADLMMHFACLLNTPAQALGLNGVILAAFFLGFPANETVLPIVFMCLGGAVQIGDISDMENFAQMLCENGWTWKTALCTILFSINHFPCATTLLTIKKETGSLKWTVVSFLIPLLTGIVICTAVNFVL